MHAVPVFRGMLSVELKKKTVENTNANCGKFEPAGSVSFTCFDIESGKGESKRGRSYYFSLFAFHKSFGQGGRSGSTFGIEFRVTCHTYFIAMFEKSRKKWEQLFVGYIRRKGASDAPVLYFCYVFCSTIF